MAPINLRFYPPDMREAILQLNDIPESMSTFLAGVTPQISGISPAFDQVTSQILAPGFNRLGANVVSVTVDGMNKIPGATAAYANISMEYQGTDAQNAYSVPTSAEAGLRTEADQIPGYSGIAQPAAANDYQ